MPVWYSARKVRVSGVPISTSVPSTEEIAAAAVAIIWFMASETAEASSSVSSCESPAGSGSLAPIIAAASRRAPSSVITNTLPPVTPST